MTLAICIASGPSLKAEDVDYCRGRGKTYVVNDTYKLAPWADVLYACDGRWWDQYYLEVCASGFKGELWTIDHGASVNYDLNSIGVLNSAAFSSHPEAVATGGNSGFQALNLAVIQGASKVVLLGYDMKLGAKGERHWHGDHPSPLLQTNKHEYDRWALHFKKAASMIGIPVINCSPGSALDCFPKANLREVL